MQNYKIQLFPPNGIYLGQMLENKKRHGKGIMLYLSVSENEMPNKIKRIYEGDWIEDERDGQGYEKFSN